MSKTPHLALWQPLVRTLCQLHLAYPLPRWHETALIEEGDSVLRQKGERVLGLYWFPSSSWCFLILLLIIFPTKLPGTAPPHLSIHHCLDRSESFS